MFLKKTRKPKLGLMIEALELRQLLSTVQIPATSDLWKIASTSPTQDGTFPPVIYLLTGANRVLTFSNVTGTVMPSTKFSRSGGADGQNFFNNVVNITSIGGISGITDSDTNSAFALIGVFVTGNIPASNPPVAQNYAKIRGNPSFSPLLDQAFFIGDGKTGTGMGAIQQFNVPNGATKLYLGFPDSYNSATHVSFQGPPTAYGDNGGSLTATLSIATPRFAVTGGVLSDVNGKAGAGLANWRIYVDANHDGQFDAGDAYVVTNAAGDFTLSLSAGTYTIGVELKNGYAIAAPKTFSYTTTLGSKAVSGLEFVVKQVTPGL